MNKISIIGAGNVGATTAEYLADFDDIMEVILLDIKEGLAEGKAIDIMQAKEATREIGLEGNAKVIGVTNDYSATENSDIIIITSGVPRKPGMTREELLGVNSNILKSILDQTSKYSPDAIYIIVSNPVDSMTYLTYKYLSISPNKVIGMGGALDSARFRYYIRKALCLDYNSEIDAIVVGGHGDTTMVPILSNATVNGAQVTSLLSKDQQEQVISDTMKGGATLTSLIGTSAWQAPAKAITTMVGEIVFNEEDYLLPINIPCSVYRPEYDLCIGTLVTLTGSGIKDIKSERDYLSRDEYEAFLHSVKAIQEVNKSLNI